MCYFKRLAVSQELLVVAQTQSTERLLLEFAALYARYKQENAKSPVLRSDGLKEQEKAFIVGFDAAVRDVRLPFSVAFMLLLPYSDAEKSGDAKKKEYIETLVDDYSYAYTRKMLRGLSATLTPGISTMQTEAPKSPKVDMSPYGSLVTLVSQLAAQEGVDVLLPDTRNVVSKLFDAVRLVTPGQGSIKNSVLFDILSQYRHADEEVRKGLGDRLEAETIYKRGLLDRLSDFPQFLQTEYASLQEAVVNYRLARHDFRDAAAILMAPMVMQSTKNRYLGAFLVGADRQMHTDFFRELFQTGKVGPQADPEDKLEQAFRQSRGSLYLEHCLFFLPSVPIQDMVRYFLVMEPAGELLIDRNYTLQQYPLVLKVLVGEDKLSLAGKLLKRYEKKLLAEGVSAGPKAHRLHEIIQYCFEKGVLDQVTANWAMSNFSTTLYVFFCKEQALQLSLTSTEFISHLSPSEMAVFCGLFPTVCAPYTILIQGILSSTTIDMLDRAFHEPPGSRGHVYIESSMVRSIRQNGAQTIEALLARTKESSQKTLEQPSQELSSRINGLMLEDRLVLFRRVFKSFVE